MESKSPKESRATLTEIVLPNDTNNLDNLMGGRLMYWMDIIAAVAAQRHSNRTTQTQTQRLPSSDCSKWHPAK